MFGTICKSDAEKLLWAAKVIEMYRSENFKHISQEGLDGEDIWEVCEEVMCADIVKRYLLKLSNELKTKSELEKLVSELSK